MKVIAKRRYSGRKNNGITTGYAFPKMEEKVNKGGCAKDGKSLVLFVVCVLFTATYKLYKSTTCE